jgi:hypothetical protein
MLSAEIVNLLYFDEKFQLKPKDDVVNPRMEICKFCDSDDLNEETERSITFQTSKCRLNVIVVYKDTVAPRFSPMRGFAASIHRQARFQPHILENMFQGMSIIKCNNTNIGSRDPTRAEIEEITRRTNLVVPFRSSSPFQINYPEMNWEPSLGDKGWVMIGNRESTRKGRKRDVCLVLYTTMDDFCMNEMEKTMQVLFERHATMEEAMVVMNKYLKYTIENRKRVLHRINRHVTQDLAGNSIREEREIQNIKVNKSTVDRLKETKIPHYQELPVSFQCTDDDSELAGEDFSSFHYSLAPELDLTFSSITPSSENHTEYIIRSCCCEIETNKKVVRLDGGPCDPIHVYNVPTDRGKLQWLSSFPCIATGKYILDYKDDFFGLTDNSRGVLCLDEGEYDETTGIQKSYECITEADKEYQIVPKIVISIKSQILEKR